MNNLIIDAANDKIFFKIIADKKSYTSEIVNNRENFDKLTLLIIKFLENNHLNINKINNIFVNQGPGKFSGIRTSISVAKALLVSNKLNLYGFSTMDLKGNKYENIINLYKKGALTKNLINAIYSS